MLPKALRELIESLGSLPGVGPRTAERYAYYLLRAQPVTRKRLETAVGAIADGVKLCPVTFALIDATEEISPLYNNSSRNKKVIAVVEEPLDVIAIEKTGLFKGTYHVLGGAMSPLEGVGPETLHIPELLDRIKDDKVNEIILATNASVEGEATAVYLQRHIRDSDVSVTMSRLARGIPIGVDLEYADQITLSHALEGRTSL